MHTILDDIRPGLHIRVPPGDEASQGFLLKTRLQVDEMIEFIMNCAKLTNFRLDPVLANNESGVDRQP